MINGISDGLIGMQRVSVIPPEEIERIYAYENTKKQWLEREGDRAKVNPEFANYLFGFNFDQINHSDPTEHKYHLANYWKRAWDKRNEEAVKHYTPYIPEKETMLRVGRFNTGKISTNVLDSLWESSKRVGIPFAHALGLAGRESGLGYARYMKQKGGLPSIAILSNWQQVQPIYNTNADQNKFTEIFNKYINQEVITEEDMDFVRNYVKNENIQYDKTRPITESPYDNALIYYMSGKYNPGEKGYNERVQREGELLLTDPGIQKWLKTKQ